MAGKNARVHGKSAKAERGKAHRGKADRGKADQGNAELGNVEVGNAELGKTEPEEKTLRQKVNGMLTAMEAKVFSKDAKITLADFIRLTHFERELAERETKEIKITWVDRLETSDSEI